MVDGRRYFHRFAHIIRYHKYYDSVCHKPGFTDMVVQFVHRLRRDTAGIHTVAVRIREINSNDPSRTELAISQNDYVHTTTVVALAPYDTTSSVAMALVSWVVWVPVFRQEDTCKSNVDIYRENHNAF